MTKFACFLEGVKIREYEVEFETTQQANEFLRGHMATACFTPGYAFTIMSKDKQYALLVENKS